MVLAAARRTHLTCHGRPGAAQALDDSLAQLSREVDQHPWNAGPHSVWSGIRETVNSNTAIPHIRPHRMFLSGSALCGSCVRCCVAELFKCETYFLRIAPQANRLATVQCFLSLRQACRRWNIRGGSSVGPTGVETAAVWQLRRAESGASRGWVPEPASLCWRLAVKRQRLTPRSTIPAKMPTDFTETVQSRFAGLNPTGGRAVKVGKTPRFPRISWFRTAREPGFRGPEC